VGNVGKVTVFLQKIIDNTLLSAPEVTEAGSKGSKEQTPF